MNPNPQTLNPTEDELFPVHRFLVPDKFLDQDQGLWYGFFTMVEDFIADEAMDEDYVPELIEIFGKVPDNEKFNWMDRYEDKLLELSTYSSLGLESYKQNNAEKQIDRIFAMIPEDRKMEFLEILFEGNIPESLLEESSTGNTAPEEVIARYRENGLQLGTGLRSTFANNNRTAMTTEELAELLDKMSNINQELTTQIKEQPVISSSVVGGKSQNPFMNFGDKIGQVIDGSLPGIQESSQVIQTPIQASVEAPRVSRPNQNLVNQPTQPTQARINGNPQPFVLPNIQSSGNTISRLTQARRATTMQPTQVPIQAIPMAQAPNTQVQESTAQKLKIAIQQKKQAEARSNTRPTVHL